MSKPGSRRRLPLPAMTALAILIIAALAGVNLWLLLKLYSRSVRSMAALSAVNYGQRIVKDLTAENLLRKETLIEPDWVALKRIVRAIHYLETNVQYVTLSENGVILYHSGAALRSDPAAAGLRPSSAHHSPDLSESRDEGGSTSTGPSPSMAEPPESTGIRIGRKMLNLGNTNVPVITFNSRIRTENGRERDIEVALRKDLVESERFGAREAVVDMFHLSLITLLLSLLLCLVLVVWLVRRELRREKQRRMEEHLSFAGAMAGGILHDFRNPLSSLRLDAQLLEKESVKENAPRRERVAELSGRMVQTIRRIDDLLQEFLITARPEDAPRSALDLNACLEDCLRLVQPRFERAGLKLDLSLSSPPLSVLGVPSWLSRAFLNVIHNAEQFSPAGGVVTIGVSAAGRDALVAIADQGPGVPPEDRKRIFEMFYSRRPGGTGIGLALARASVENCGGSIAVKEAPGGGACFEIRLPLAGVEDR